MLWKIEIKKKDGFYDSVGERIKKDINGLGFTDIKEVKFIQVYYIDGSIEERNIEKISQLLLSDGVTQEYSYCPFPEKNSSYPFPNDIKVEIAYHTGVMDPWEESIKKGIKTLHITEPQFVKTSKEYIIKGEIEERKLDTICNQILMNPIIQHVVEDENDILSKPSGYEFKLIEIDLLSASDEELMEISENMQLSLTLQEMRTIKQYFQKLGRKPTDVELESLAQTWSEHCKHKTLRGNIEYIEKHGGDKKVRNYDNLLKETIMQVTDELDKDWCVSVFVDNSGIIKFNSNYNICFKVETHNHPSALEPYGGANTGIGGVIRDPLGTGLGGKPIFNTDVFCFAPPSYPQDKIPEGILHPKRVMKGVVSGVRDYGNKMGIPTINGAVIFDDDYLGNPLVYCGNAAIMPKEYSFKKISSGDLIFVAGGKTGRDGIHGATFSSAELTQESEDISSQAVQIGNPITEKKMEKAIIRARDENLYNAITDCGAGGLSSAVGELGEETGAEVNLEKVPLKYKGLSYSEIWISEAQERMVLVVPEENTNKLKEIFKEEEVELTHIGQFTDDGRLTLFYEGNKVADMKMQFLHHGLPKVKRKAIWEDKSYPEPKNETAHKLGEKLIELLSSLNIASKEWIIRQYDHEVQGKSVLKPLVGIENDGPSDASVVRPLLHSQKGLGVACGINSRFGKIDPYWMGASVIDEAIRQLVAVGIDPKRIALLDNFCWGNTNKPKQLGSLVRAANACYDIAKKMGTPFISGKDSLNNEFKTDNESIPIPPTLLISSIGITDNISNIISIDLKKSDNLIYIVGTTLPELGGSEYYNTKGYLGNRVPKVTPDFSRFLYKKIHEAIKENLITSAHDCSEGGIGVATAEMAFAGGLGVNLFLNEVPYEGKKRNDYILFSESNSRLILEVEKEKIDDFEKKFNKIPYGIIGCVRDNQNYNVYGIENNKIISANINDLKESWKEPLNW